MLQGWIDALRRSDRRLRVSTRSVAASIVVSMLALAGCGGGQGTDAAGAGASSRVRALNDPAVNALSSSRPIDTATLFDWAQVLFASLFPPGPVNDSLESGGTTYTIRYYAGTGNYLGVSDGRVYGYGPFTNFQLVSFGFTADFTCQAAPQNCLPPTGIAMAWDAAGPVWDGSDWQ